MKRDSLLPHLRVALGGVGGVEEQHVAVGRRGFDTQRGERQLQGGDARGIDGNDLPALDVVDLGGGFRLRVADGIRGRGDLLDLVCQHLAGLPAESPGRGLGRGPRGQYHANQHRQNQFAQSSLFPPFSETGQRYSKGIAERLEQLLRARTQWEAPEVVFARKSRKAS